jgi:2-oxoglutarate ferredoxin oxidoreductase subunit delta
MGDKKSFTFTIREKWCKGCGICVAYCPKQVLVLKDGKVFPERRELCIGCRMCEFRCPDFAIEVRAEAAAGAEREALTEPVNPEAAHD